MREFLEQAIVQFLHFARGVSAGALQARAFNVAADDAAHFGSVERFADVVVRAETQRLFRGIERAETGEHDDGNVRIDFANFAIALILLGLGWNFGFIGGTTLLTGTYALSERAKVQGFNDFAISVTMAIGSLSSGKLLSSLGWNAVNLAVFPMAALGIALVFWLARQPRTRPA